MSICELARIIPVIPPVVNIVINLVDHRLIGDEFMGFPLRVVIHLNTLILVGMAMIMVAEVKYAWVLMFIPTVNI
jgi:hypothetical protein